jgi:D-aminopeptidase
MLMKDINYSELEVIGVTDILVNDGYSEAVNIVVERMTIDKAREIKLNSLISEVGRI